MKPLSRGVGDAKCVDQRRIAASTFGHGVRFVEPAHQQEMRGVKRDEHLEDVSEAGRLVVWARPRLSSPKRPYHYRLVARRQPRLSEADERPVHRAEQRSGDARET